MTQTNNKFFDEFSKMMNNTAGAFRSMRTEAGSMFKSQFEKWANDMNLVKGEEFETVRDMAKKVRSDNNKLKNQMAALEERISAIEPKNKQSQNIVEASTSIKSEKRAKRVGGGKPASEDVTAKTDIIGKDATDRGANRE